MAQAWDAATESGVNPVLTIQEKEPKMAFDTMCPHCGGLIARPNVAYGYAGPYCSCQKPKSLDGETEKSLADWQRRVTELEERLSKLEHNTHQAVMDSMRFGGR
jgi:reverse gyrase